MNHKTVRAVALSFNPETSRAPSVVAKGEGVLARKIIEISEKNGVEIVNDPDLSRLLYELPVHGEIPESLYKTVAALYAYFYRLNREM